VKKKIIVIFLICMFYLPTVTLTFARQTTNASNNGCLDPYVMIEGEVTGIVFDIHAYYIINGVDNDFHQESWECTITEESGINCIVPVPEDGRDHYTLTGIKSGYRTNIVDIYITPDDGDWVWAQVELIPILSKTVNPTFLKILNLFPIIERLFDF
jgi:hypothetical protein